MLYLYSSYGCWHSAFSYGLRFYVDYMVIFSFLIASFWEDIYSHKKIYHFCLLIMFLTIIITLYFTLFVSIYKADGSLEPFFEIWIQNIKNFINLH